MHSSGLESLTTWDSFHWEDAAYTLFELIESFNTVEKTRCADPIAAPKNRTVKNKVDIN
jgi:hypothetical protein